MFKRDEYLGYPRNCSDPAHNHDGYCQTCAANAHRRYFGEIANETKFTPWPDLVNKCRFSKDPYYNDVPLRYFDYQWAAYGRRIDEVLKERGDYRTAAGIVCICKEAIRQILEQEAE